MNAHRALEFLDLWSISLADNPGQPAPTIPGGLFSEEHRERLEAVQRRIDAAIHETIGEIADLQIQMRRRSRLAPQPYRTLKLSA